MNDGAAMELTAFRNDLREVIDRLDESGPLRLTKYNDTVAEIRSATPEGERRYTAAILDTIRYFEKWSEGLTWVLARAGIDTLAALTELARRHKEFTDGGVTFDAYPEHTLPDEGSVTVDEALARLYFGDDHPDGTEDPYAWFLACARLQSEASERGMGAQLPCPNSYDETSPTFVEMAIASGYTPETFVAFGISAMDQGVQLERLADMLGKTPVPADVLAMEHYDDYTFGRLTEAGLPHAEAVTVFRRNLDTSDAEDLARAGIRSADEIERLVNDKLNIGLAVRASQDGLTPEEWKVQVPRVQHLKYPGAPRPFGSEEAGLLPFRLLVEAAQEKLSLVRWDTNSLRVTADRTIRYFHANPDRRQTLYPWVHIYPDRVLDVARAGMSPSFVTAFGNLMEHHFTGAAAPDDFTDLAIRVHGLGLTTGMANAMSRSDGKRPVFSPEQLIAVLEAGLSDVGTAHYLAERHGDPQEWMVHLRQRRERQLMTDAFLATVENTDIWEAVRTATLALRGLIKSRLLPGDIYLKGVVEKHLTGGMLNDHELQTLLASTAYVFDARSYLPKAWQEENGKYAEPIRQLAKSFDATRKAQNT